MKSAQIRQASIAAGFLAIGAAIALHTTDAGGALAFLALALFAAALRLRSADDTRSIAQRRLDTENVGGWIAIAFVVVLAAVALIG